MDAKIDGSLVKVEMSPEEAEVLTQLLTVALDMEQGEYDQSVDASEGSRSEETENRLMMLDAMFTEMSKVCPR